MSQGEKKEFTPPPEAKQDADGFWIMPDKSFYDPDGYFFNSEGKDQFGGYYNEEGVYVPPQNEEDSQEEEEKQEKDVPQGYSKHSNFIPKIEGASFNKAGFYILPNEGGFYDPLGNYFDKNGYDLTGGYYTDDGEYVPGTSELLDEQEDHLEEQEKGVSEIEEQYANQKYPHDPENYVLDSEEVAANQTQEKAEIGINEQKVEQDEDEEEEGVVVSKLISK